MSFEREAWGDLAENEKTGDFGGEEKGYGAPERRALNAYYQIKEIADRNAMGKKLVTGLQRSLLRYIGTIDTLSMSLVTNQSGEEKQAADEARTRAHNALISDLNIISRFCEKNKIDNSWRNVVGSDRKEITLWALAVSPTIKKELQA